MAKNKEQYGWNILFIIIYLALLAYVVWGAREFGYISVYDLQLIDYILIIGASWRLVRMFVYDLVTKFIREQFLEETLTGGLKKPDGGIKRTLADLFSCPMCISIWVGTVVVFLYFIIPVMPIIYLILTVSAIATFLQNFSRAVAKFADSK